MITEYRDNESIIFYVVFLALMKLLKTTLLRFLTSKVAIVDSNNFNSELRVTTPPPTILDGTSNVLVGTLKISATKDNCTHDRNTPQLR